MIREPIYQGQLQSDLDFAGFSPVNLDGWPPTGGVGASGGGDITQLADGHSYIVVTFDTVQPDANWKFTQLLVANMVDSTPLNLWPGTLTAKSTTGFTLQISGSPDSDNYYLHWGFTGTGGGTGTAPLSPLPGSATASDLLVSSIGTRTAIASLAPNTGNWFDSQTFDPCIIVNPSDSSQLLMFFSGMGAPVLYGEQKIGRATASITSPSVWTVSNSGNPVLIASLGWETSGSGLRADSVIYNPGDSKIYLFYTARDAVVAVASSTDLGLTWTKLGQLFTPTAGETNISQMAVILEGTTLHGIYAYRTAGAVLPAYRYATASTSNFVSWTKGEVDIYSDPESGRYHEFHQFFKVGSTYMLCYESGNTTVDFDLRFATSSSPSSGWAISPNTPFFVKSGTVGAFDEFHVATGNVAIINGFYYLVYCGALDHAQPYATNHWQMGIVPLGY